MNSQHLAAYIKKHARNNPAKSAIKFNGTDVSYLDLEKKSNQMANFFYEKIHKVRKDYPNSSSETYNAAVLLDRCPEIIISLMGIIKAGMVFVPISPNIPAKRLELLLAETKACWVVTSLTCYKRFEEFFKTHNELNVLLIAADSGDSEPALPGSIFTIDFNDCQEELQFELTYNKYCYIYFTSGSTGVPRGVLGRHRSLHHYIDWQIREFNVDDTFNVSQFIPPTFDPYLRDVLVPLLAGGTICIPDYDTLMNPAKLIAWIDENRITLIHIVPSLFRLISREIRDAHHFVDLKYIFLAGELLRGSDIRRFMEIFAGRILLVNQYGPTETTLAKFFYKIKPGDINRSIIPVGKPIADAEALILDPKMRKCLTENTGEIYIRTPYISSGYFNKKELNREVFIRNPFSRDQNDIIYKTGDMGRLLFDGNIELTGRVDNQVKIRGQRVEPGEIENLLLNIPYIKEAVVVDKEDKNNEKFLCAYLVLENSSAGKAQMGITQLKSLLAGDLPVYMVPSYFIALDALPLNPNGKTDRQALKKMEINLESETDYTPPGNELEEKIARVWKETLKLTKVGVNDHFFNIGGTSLNAITINNKLNEILGMETPMVKFFEYPTISLFAKYLSGDAPAIINREDRIKRINTATQKKSNLTSRKQRLKELRHG